MPTALSSTGWSHGCIVKHVGRANSAAGSPLVPRVPASSQQPAWNAREDTEGRHAILVDDRPMFGVGDVNEGVR